MDSAVTEIHIQKQIIDTLRAYGWRVYRMNAGRKGGMRLHPAGTPDLMAQRRGETVWIEVKQPGKHPTEVQIECHNQLRADQFACGVAYGVEDVEWMKGTQFPPLEWVSE